MWYFLKDLAPMVMAPVKLEDMQSEQDLSNLSKEELLLYVAK